MDRFLALTTFARVVVIYATRWLLLKLLRQADAARLVWIAPRGLITVLLFLTAVETGSLDRFPFGTVMLVVLATSALTALAQRNVDSAAPETPLPAAAPVAAAAGDPPASDRAIASRSS